MRQTEFQDQAKRWLSWYKREVLTVPENGVWLRNGRKYDHILPREKYSLNILPSFRDEFWHWFGTQKIQLQRDFHHLNSSRALCFNLFYPLIRGNCRSLNTLLSIMNIEGLPDTCASFEFEPDPTEGTCIDLSLPLMTGARINFEVKYTESEFGSASEDEQHLEKFETIYRPRLAQMFEESFCSPAQFLKHYQIARNIWHLADAAGNVAVFLFPRTNACLKRDEYVIKTCAVDNLRARIRIVYLEDLIMALQRCLEPTEITQQQQLREFQLKYFRVVKN